MSDESNGSNKSNKSDKSDKSDISKLRIERNRKMQERLIRFAQKIVRLCKKLPKNSINQRLVPQLVASSNSISANYAEACASGSKADFLNKLRLVFKESNETRSHLRVIYNRLAENSKRELGDECELIKTLTIIAGILDYGGVFVSLIKPGS